jgi:hypothetical protein
MKVELASTLWAFHFPLGYNPEFNSGMCLSHLFHFGGEAILAPKNCSTAKRVPANWTRRLSGHLDCSVERITTKQSRNKRQQKQNHWQRH